MALLSSTMLPLGTPAPDFSLPNHNARFGEVGGRVALADYANAKALVVVFMCNHCPYVVHVRDALARLGEELVALGCALVGINSNDAVAYPSDSPEAMQVEAHAAGYGFAYLFDESQEVARAYDAACTPDIYVFDGAAKLAYRGQLDASRPGNGVPTDASDVRRAVQQILAGRAPSDAQVPSIGCSIKWRR